jgi:nucleoside-diphosphate-sugar epimerase
MEAARIAKVKRVVWASTQSVYGLAKSYPPGPVSEDIFVDPVTLYGACKLFNEHIARHYKSVHGLDNIGFRKAVVYGLGKSRRRDLSIAHLLIENALLGRPVVMPPVDYRANYVYVKDIVRAYLLAIQAPSPEHIIFNIGGQVFQNSEVVALLKKFYPDLVVHQQKDYGLPHPIEVYEQETVYARDELGYEPAYSLEDGIRDYQAVKERLGRQYESAWTELNVTSLL